MVNALHKAPSAPCLDVTIDHDHVAKLENFLMTETYKQMVAGTKKFNRKLNEERVSRMPYVDGQTGVAMKNHDGSRSRRERMPGVRQGQLYTYPSKRWKKSSYQYLKFPNGPTNIDFGQEIQKVDAWTPGSALTTPGGVLRLPWQQPPGGAAIGASPGLGDGRSARQPARAASSVSNVPGMGVYGGGFYEDGLEDMDKSGSDDDYESGRSKRSKGKKSRRKAPGSGATPGRGPRRSIAPPPPAAYNVPAHIPVDQFDPPPQLVLPPKKGTPTGYCDFCLGGQVAQDKSDDGKVLNRKSNLPEVLIACAVCGHSGHPTCLQFTANMLTSVSGYPWQCMECKTCTVCSTSENDDQLLFCDDCDRGYHMYCIVPPMKEAPEGTWSCVICVDKFHKD